MLKKRYVIFCEGDTEYNYTEKMRKKQGVELVLKPINMHGGGYSNFLRQIKKESQSNCLAKFIIVDGDRIVGEPGEKDNFLKLLDYCRLQNGKGSAPLFVIVNSPDFEYVACLHDEDYKGQDTKSYILRNWGYRTMDAFKNDLEVYEFLNTGHNSFENMLDIIRGQDKLLKNRYEIKKKTFDISIKSTVFNQEMLGQRTSNIEEFFDVLDW